MSHELKEGVELELVEWPDTKGTNETFYALGSDISSIKVVMQYGQLSMCPWAKITNQEGNMIALVNLALCVRAVIRNGQ